MEDTETWQRNRCWVTEDDADDDEDDDDNNNTEEEEELEASTADDKNMKKPLTYIGGTDISFVKDDLVNACAAIVVVRLPGLEVVYEDLSMVKLTAPYIPGFLAFRESEFLIEKFKTLKKNRPEIMPQAIVVDGNGTLHPLEFGLACHVGVSLGIPTVGAAKTLYHVDGIAKNQEHQEKVKALLQKAGDRFPLVGESGRTLGVALRSCDKTTNPIYVSSGHNISLETAVWLVQLCSKFRVPEPVRQADIKSRQYIRENWSNKHRWTSGRSSIKELTE